VDVTHNGNFFQPFHFPCLTHLTKIISNPFVLLNFNFFIHSSLPFGIRWELGTKGIISRVLCPGFLPLEIGRGMKRLRCELRNGHFSRVSFLRGNPKPKVGPLVPQSQNQSGPPQLRMFTTRPGMSDNEQLANSLCTIHPFKLAIRKEPNLSWFEM